MDVSGRPMIVSYRWVPSSSGSPVLLYELFRHFPADSVTVVCGPGLHPRGNLSLPFHTRRLTVERADRYLNKAYKVLGHRALPVLVAALRRIVRRRKPSVIYAHYPDGGFMTAAGLVAEELGIPLVIGYDILWGGNMDQALSDRYERRIARYARRRFAITEMACEELEQRHGVPFELMPHVILPPDPRPAAVPRERRRHAVHLGGNVYGNMNLDAVQRLHRVLEAMPDRPDFEIYGFNDAAALRAQGIDGPFVKLASVARDQLAAIQSTASILYLPEAFDSPVPEMIRHNFPTKALEYMVAGSPILVHAPADSYLARCAREHGWGLVVDRPDDAALRDAVGALLGDEDLRARVVAGGWRFVASRDGRTWARVMQEALGMVTADASAAVGAAVAAE